MLDEAAMSEFVREDYARLVNVVALVAGSSNATEDLVQEALARAWTRSRRGEEIASLPHWVAAVALNLSRSRWRRLGAERRAHERLGQASTNVAAPDADRVEVMRALAALPRRQREVAVLRYLMDMTTSEAAATLRVSEGTVKNSLAKARKALARELVPSATEVTDDVEA